MTRKRKLLVTAAILLPSLFFIYLATNNWHLIPKVFTTYSGIAMNNSAISDTGTVSAKYRKFCGGCHGWEMGTFVNHDWKFGKTKSAIFKAIKYGYPNTGMPGFDSAFSDKEIYHLSNYLLNGINNQKKQPGRDKGYQVNYFPTEQLAVKLDTVATGVGVPWCVAFLPDNELLVTDRNGKLYRVKNKVLQPVQGLPYIVAEGQGGLFDVLLHPGLETTD